MKQADLIRLLKKLDYSNKKVSRASIKQIKDVWFVERPNGIRVLCTFDSGPVEAFTIPKRSILAYVRHITEEKS